LLRVIADGNEVFSRQYPFLRPPEMERIVVNFGDSLRPNGKITLKMEPGGRSET